MDKVKGVLVGFLLLILATMPGMVVGEEKEEDIEAIAVKAEGVGPLTEAGVAPARKVALEDALKLAVEQARGVMIQSETVVKDFTTVRDEILSKSKGAVKRYEILHEKKIEEDKVYWVGILAFVLLANPKASSVLLDPENYQRKAPKILAEIKELGLSTNEVAKRINAQKTQGMGRQTFVGMINRYRMVIQVLNAIQPPEEKKERLERLKEAVNLKARATFNYGRYILKDRQAGILERANKLNQKGNGILRKLKDT